MIERDALIELIAEYAVGHLNHDDEHPDIGWAMSNAMAIELAEKDVIQEAARWNSLAALALDFEDVRYEVSALVAFKRNILRR